MPTSLLCPDAFLSPLEIDATVLRALAEDLGRAGDVTSTATVPEGTRGRAIVVARQPGTVSGLPLVAAAMRRLAKRTGRLLAKYNCTVFILFSKLQSLRVSLYGQIFSIHAKSSSRS